jgi:hypothetical protein
MNFFGECLTLGSYLSQKEKEALYRFLLETKNDIFKADAKNFLKSRFLTTYIANGEIQYGIEDDSVFYTAREVNSAEFCPALRRLSLKVPKIFQIRRLVRFFAQSEVDVISNFPLPGANAQPKSGYGFNAIPFYDLNYYSNGKGRLRGLREKLKNSNSEILTKLRTL